MKRIGVISDTHGGPAVTRLCTEIAGDVDCWFHLGDYISDAAELKKLTGKPVYTVRGNCDEYSDDFTALSERVVEISGKRFFLIHGHSYGVKESLSRAAYRAEELHCDALLFGHTHISLIDNYDGLLIVNPGSPRLPHGSRKPSFAILTITDDGKLRAQIVPVK